MENPTAAAEVKIRGYKKFMKRIRKIRKELIKFNRELERSVELEKKLVSSSEKINKWFS